ncbi:MAG: type II secretion system F family protein [Myxococcales bacterium]
MSTETCPKCGKARPPGATECPSCGIVYGRFRNIARPAPLRSEPAPQPESQEQAQPPQFAVGMTAAPRVQASSPSTAPAYVSGKQAENVLRLIAHSLEAGLTMSAFARSGGLHGLPLSTVSRLTADADAGVPLSQSLRNLGLIDEASAGMLRAKEKHGGQPSGLVAIAERIAHRRAARNKALWITLYPYALLLALAVIRPIPVAFSRGLGPYLAAAFPGVATLIGLPLFLFAVLPRLDPAGRLASKALGLLASVPFLGLGAKNDALASFVDVLGASIASGVSLREALPLAAQAGAGAPGFAEAGPRAVARLDAGASLAVALSEFPGLPSLVVAQIASGEAAGRLDQVLESSRRSFQEKARIGWIGLAIFVGSLLVLTALAAIALSIVSGFSDAMRQMSEGIDTIAPPSP